MDTYAAKGKVVGVAASKIEVLAVELKLLTLDLDEVLGGVITLGGAGRRGQSPTSHEAQGYDFGLEVHVVAGPKLVDSGGLKVKRAWRVFKESEAPRPGVSPCDGVWGRGMRRKLILSRHVGGPRSLFTD
jgi:hypothetical protein